MKIAVAAEGRDATSRVDERFGRAAYFVIHDTESGAFETIENGANVSAAHGAGTGSAQEIVSRNVDVVVSGQVGPKAEAVLSAAGIKMVAWSDGTVSDAIGFVLGQAKA